MYISIYIYTYDQVDLYVRLYTYISSMIILCCGQVWGLQKCSTTKGLFWGHLAALPGCIIDFACAACTKNPISFWDFLHPSKFLHRPCANLVPRLCLVWFSCVTPHSKDNVSCRPKIKTWIILDSDHWILLTCLQLPYKMCNLMLLCR